MEDTPDTVQCKHCRRPVLRVKAPEHIKSCLSKKQEKLKKKKEAKEAKDAALRRERGEGASQAGDDNDISTSKGGARKSALKGSEAGADDEGGLMKKAGKKRKAEGEPGDKAVKTKKKKEEPKAKTAKPKGPVDVEKQCGVPLPNGAQCARSLTCKSHSMGAKRAVPGRSLPYDMLLAQYQKKNQAKQQREFLFPLLSSPHPISQYILQPIPSPALSPTLGWSSANTAPNRRGDRRQRPPPRRLRHPRPRRLRRRERSHHGRHRPRTTPTPSHQTPHCHEVEIPVRPHEGDAALRVTGRRGSWQSVFRAERFCCGEWRWGWGPAA